MPSGRATKTNTHMEDITEDETRKAAIAAAAEQAEKPVETEAADQGAVEAAAKTERKKAARKKAEQVKEEGVAAAEANEDRNLYWRGPTRLLKSAFARVARAAGGSKSLPILRCVGLTWDEYGLTLHATNLDIHAQQKIGSDEESDVSGWGGVAVEAAALGKLLDRAGKEIQLRKWGTLAGFGVSSDSWQAELVVLSVDDMPPMPRVDGKGLYFPSRALKKMLKAVYPATSGDTTRYVLNGVSLDFSWPSPKEWDLQVVGTDGRRLAKLKTSVKELGGSWVGEGGLSDVWEQERNIIIPNELVAFLLATLTGNEKTAAGFGVVTVPEPGGDHDKVVGCWVVEEGFQVWSKVIEGTYPDFERVVPSTAKDEIAIDIDAVVDAVGRAEVLAGGDKNSVGLRFYSREVTVSADEMDRGKWTEKLDIIPVEWLVTESCAVNINPDYVPPMGGTGVGRLDIGHARSGGPLVWRSLLPLTEGCDAQFTYVLMPMRVEGGAK
jgi:DNA polymerase-3 subunit beta